MKNIPKYLLILSIAYFMASCGTSTGSRYDKNEKKAKLKEESTKEVVKLPKEDFDITNYRTKLKVKGSETASSNPAAKVNAWYNFKEQPDTGSDQRIPVGKVPGFRVRVLSTDNLIVADSVRSDLYFQTDQKGVYVDFDPPFYKVKVGDFLNMNDAKNLSFKLNQIGYPEAKVVNDSVNVYK